MVARLLLAIAALHVNENDAHDWMIGFWRRFRCAITQRYKSWCTLTWHVPHLGILEGIQWSSISFLSTVKTVEAVPLMHGDG